MPMEAHILPKSQEGEDDSGPQKPEKSRRTGKLTKIACYECRKRKCKCDGKQPVCGPCQGRNVTCDFDAISGSASTEELKHRVRSLEANNQSLIGENGRVWDLNRDLNSQVRRLTDELGYHQVQSSWASSYGPDASFPAGEEMILDDTQEQEPREAAAARRDRTNEAVQSFLNGRRQLVSDANSSQRKTEDVLPTLDVTNLFQASHVPDELSYWALQLSMSDVRDTLLAKLADAYVTYLQLSWLILPVDETANLMPEFIRVSALNELCIPHPVDINITQDNSLEAPMVVVENSRPGSSGGVPTLLCSDLAPWQHADVEATYLDQQSHRMRLTPIFEAFAREADNWALRVDAQRSRHQSIASGSSMAET